MYSVNRKSLEIAEVKKEIRIIGMRRSGNHALINWIVSQIPGDTLFFNDVDIFDPLNKNCLVGFYKDNSNGKYDCIIYSYEDRLLSCVSNANIYPQKKVYKHAAKEKLDLIILRDPFNLLASRRKYIGQLDRKTTYISGLKPSQLWITYANEYLGVTKYLRNKKIAVNYNKWCSSKKYRAELANSLGIVFTDHGFGKVAKFGGGSSFDSTKYDGQASEMETTQRWEKFKYDNHYSKSFRDYKLLNLSEKIFTLEPELKEYININLHPQVRNIAALERRMRILIFPMMINYAINRPLVQKIYKSWIQPLRKKNTFQIKK